MELKSVLFVGLGGVGSAHAIKMAGYDPGLVRVLAGGERLRRYQEQGFLVNGKRFDFFYADPDDPKASPADLILMAVKGHDLAQGLFDVNAYVGPNTIILSLLNGITSEERIAAAYPQAHVLYGLCMSIAANRSGNQIQFESPGRIYFGDQDNRVLSPQVQAVSQLFQQAGIESIVPEDMLRMLWFKFMLNVGVNQTTALLRAPYSIIHRSPEAREIMDAAMWEVIHLAQTRGVTLGQEDIDQCYQILFKLDPESRTSMCDDVLAGRKTEIEEFAGTVCRLGKECGIATPMNHFLNLAITSMESVS